MMCNGKLILLVWHYMSSRPFPQPCNFTARWLGELHADGLLETTKEGIMATERGRVHVETMLNLPLPVQKWVAA